MREEWDKLSDRERVGVVVLAFGLLLLFFAPGTGRVVGPGRYSEIVTQVTVALMVVFGIVSFSLPSTPRWFRYVPVVTMTAWFVGGRVVSLWAFRVDLFASWSRLAVEAGLWGAWGWILWSSVRRLRAETRTRPAGVTDSDTTPSAGS